MEPSLWRADTLEVGTLWRREEMVASKCWPLGRNRPSMRIEMVNLPVFGEDVGVLFPCFDIKLAEDETAEDFTAIVEWEVQEILDEMSNEEYLA
jgi:hypothetical protein